MKLTLYARVLLPYKEGVPISAQGISMRRRVNENPLILTEDWILIGTGMRIGI